MSVFKAYFGVGDTKARSPFKDMPAQIRSSLEMGRPHIAQQRIEAISREAPKAVERLFNLLSRLANDDNPNKFKFAKGGWVKGTGNNDTVPAWLTPGEYVVSKPMINSLTGRNANAATTHNVTHETNINVDVSNPTGKAIVDALNPVLFGLRHKP